MMTTSHDSGAATLEARYLAQRMEAQGYQGQSELHTVQLISFDKFLAQENIDFSGLRKVAFKIDVEGHEISVLRGMENFLRQTKDLELLLVVEVHRKNFEEIQSYFNGHGFKQSWPDENAVASFLGNKGGSAIDLIFYRE